jgi:signal transduction histidine kinase
LKRAAVEVAVAALAAVGVSAIAWPVYGHQAFVEGLEILGPLGVATTVVAHILASHRGSLRGRLGALAALVALQLGAAVALFAWRMFVSADDALFMALAAGYAGLIGLGAAQLVARRALTDLDAVRVALADVGEGAREVTVRVRGRDELAALAADVETMVRRVDAEERARRRLVASVSHDLRTPITSLQLIADGLEDDVLDPTRLRDHLKLVSTHVRALGALIDDLFELSRLEAGDIRWSIEQVRVDELVQETLDAMRPQAEDGSVSMRSELPGDLRPARANPEQLQRVLFNLIQNAIRHTPADGSVVVRAWPVTGEALEIEVADTGTGIEPRERERVFEPFVQGPSRVEGKSGSAGLGLAIARAIVEAHGGKIWVAQGGPGTHIRFTVPAA